MLWFPLRILLPRVSAKPKVATISDSAEVKSHDALVLAECVRKPLVIANALSGRHNKNVKTHTYTRWWTHMRTHTHTETWCLKPQIFKFVKLKNAVCVLNSVHTCLEFE